MYLEYQEHETEPFIRLSNYKGIALIFTNPDQRWAAKEVLLACKEIWDTRFVPVGDPVYDTPPRS